QEVTQINVQFTEDPTNIFSNFSLVRSDDADFASTGDNTAVGTTTITVVGNTLEIVPTTAIDISAAKNLFLVAGVDPSVTGTTGPIQASLTTADITLDRGNKAGSATGTAYSFTALTATIAS